MSKTTAPPTQLTSQYSTKVADDLDLNRKEQERISGEIEALKAQLVALEQDHTVLVNVQQALGASAAPAVPKSSTAVRAPRKKKTATSKADKQPQAKKSATPAPKQSRKTNTPKASAVPSAQPTLVDLVREHLTGQGEPRSAAEITAELDKQYPKRNVKTTVVRTTLENLVAKNQAQRTKQGASVFYTAPEAAGAAAQDKSAAQQAAGSDR
ncbi:MULTISPECIES: BlaI/MecI/CopY family transcriptional regulator [Streptomyces]|uniref:BlaI/MecI/CopY family transcriptional regulator n=1 Tax=Streptomyces TaxID=1883 RepID=UPI001B32F335|nr:BlaI/MecI/CopY family transcriptional regulator [Streptomyces sp. AgN23]QTI90615.1 BlaI/MecI/CopY family transcriptional regulator [Streptomyces sp. AgN23]WTA78559.1 BlaI/MecI/CopY family transcriptional regulator [Streptomyces antimycoticus]WTA86841.1 BlaI/MecI/CopY family transcriptional regulator [Streptomyces antimycoticus]